MGFTDEEIWTQWSQDSIKWKVLLPGSGQSSIVEKEAKIFLTSADQDGNKRFLLCYEKKSGKLLWKREVKYAGQENIHRMNSWATPTPVTSEDKVIAFFGPAGLHCFDLNGNPEWKLSLGDFLDTGESPHHLLSKTEYYTRIVTLWALPAYWP